jgi:hypothetical protein
MLNERSPDFNVLRSLTVVTGGNEHFPEITITFDSSFPIVFVSAFPTGTTNVTPVSEGVNSHA